MSLNPASKKVLNPIAAALLLAGLAACINVVPTTLVGDDFEVLYAMGVGLLTGENVYARENFSAMLYPPATGFPFVLFALLPYTYAKPAFFVLMLAVLVFGLRALIRLAAPKSEAYVWMGLTGIVLLSAAIRWGMMLLQMAPLLLGLLCLLIVALHTGKTRSVFAIATIATVLKVTLALPFLGLLLLRRRFAAIGVACGSWLALCALGFLRLGRDSLTTYRTNVAALQSLDDPANINMPDLWRAVALPRLDWVSLFYSASRNLPISQLLTYVATGFVGLVLLREIWRTTDTSLTTTTLFLTPMVCVGSLAVYHHQYDLSVFFAPALLLLFSQRTWRPLWAVLLILPITLIVLLLPIGTAQSMLGRIDPIWGPALVKLSFPTALTLALVGSLVLLRGRAEPGGDAREAREPEPAPSVTSDSGH